MTLIMSPVIDQTLIRLPHAEFQEGSDYGYQAQRGTMTWDLLFRRKSLRQLLADVEGAGLSEGDVLVRDLLDGGETVYYRLYDGEGTYVKHVY